MGALNCEVFQSTEETGALLQAVIPALQIFNSHPDPLPPCLLSPASSPTSLHEDVYQSRHGAFWQGSCAGGL